MSTDSKDPQQLTVKEALEQGNLLIADFMGYYFQGDKFYSHSSGKGNWFKEAKYDRSWDWLMPVAKIIIRLPPLRGKAISHINQMDRVISALMTADMDKIYFSCIDFIKWYNTQKLIPNDPQ